MDEPHIDIDKARQDEGPSAEYINERVLMWKALGEKYRIAYLPEAYRKDSNELSDTAGSKRTDTQGD